MAMTPALLIRMSRREDFEVNCSAACLIDAKSVRSRGRTSMLAPGTSVLTSWTAAFAFSAEREVM